MNQASANILFHRMCNTLNENTDLLWLKETEIVYLKESLSQTETNLTNVTCDRNKLKNLNDQLDLKCVTLNRQLLLATIKIKSLQERMLNENGAAVATTANDRIESEFEQVESSANQSIELKSAKKRKRMEKRPESKYFFLIMIILSL